MKAATPKCVRPSFFLNLLIFRPYKKRIILPFFHFPQSFGIKNDSYNCQSVRFPALDLCLKTGNQLLLPKIEYLLEKAEE